MKVCKQIGWMILLSVASLSLDLSRSALAQDLITPRNVNVPCREFQDYVDQHQADILRAVGAPAGARAETYWGLTKRHRLLANPDRVYDIPPNRTKKRFHCACSGRDVDSYEAECPNSIACFTDFTCPHGQDCSNKICGREHLSKVELVDSVYSAFFQWSPQPVPEQCRQTMSDWNRKVEQHEKSHNTEDRAALDVLEAELSNLQTPESCAPTEDALKAKLDEGMDDLIKDAERNFLENVAAFSNELHSTIGADDPPPDCSCMER